MHPIREANLFQFSVSFSSFPQTPLHLAANSGSVECVNALLQHGADVNAKDVRNEEGERASHERRCVGEFCVIY